MESIKQTINDLSQVFNKRMADFERSLQEKNSSATFCLSKEQNAIQEDFQNFKQFVIFALNSLQKQLDILSIQCDNLEMRSRKKMLLIHGVPEEDKEDLALNMSKIFSHHIEDQDISASSISKCMRLGQVKKDKPRPILIKFNKTEVRSKIWFSKTNLKGTGVSLSEFLTKDRYKTFLEARQRFGISKCWTKDGCIFVLGPDGTRHRAVYVSDLEGIPVSTDDNQAVVTSASLPSKLTRSKKQAKRK